MQVDDPILKLEAVVLLFYEGQRSEAELVEAVYKATKPCRKMVYNILRCWDTAADVHQAITIKYINKLRQGVVISSPVSWFGVCMYRRALTEVKKGRPWGRFQVELPPDYLLPAQTLLPPDEAVYYREVCAFIDALPERDRAIFLAQARDGLTAGETALLLNESHGAVRSRYFRTRHALKAHLSEPLPLTRKTKASGGDEIG